MLQAAGVWPKRALELANCANATTEVISPIIDRCRQQKPKELGRYVAAAVARAVESHQAKAVREAKSTTGLTLSIAPTKTSSG